MDHTEVRNVTDSFSLRYKTTGEVFPLKGEVTLGRVPDCDIVVSEGHMSRYHAKVSMIAGTAVVEDLNSTNGSYLNGKEVEKPTPMQPGDVLQLDTAEFELISNSQPAAAPPPPTPAATQLTQRVKPRMQMASEQADVAKPDIAKPDIAKPTAAANGGRNPAWLEERAQGPEGTRVIKASETAEIQKSIEELTALREGGIPANAGRLVGAGESSSGQVFELVPSNNESTTWEIGRDPSCHVVINDTGVSGNHAQLINRGKRWKLVNLMATNGTIVNGQEGLTAYLQDGDKIRFGQTDYVFFLGGSDGAASPASASGGNKMLLGIIGTVVVIGLAAAGLYFGGML